MIKNNIYSSTLNKLGFTLVELLVAISIIGILVSVGLASFSAAQKQARNTNRKSDLRQYQNSLENFSTIKGGLYPSRITAAGVRLSTTICSDLGLTSCVEDTRYSQDTSFVYLYQSDGSDSGAVDASKYVIWTKIENSSNFWVICSDGKVGEKAQGGFSVIAGSCPL